MGKTAKTQTEVDALVDRLKREARSKAAAEWVPLKKLRLWKKNPRANEGEPVERVIASMKRFGFGAPIVARRINGEIIAGHTRYKAALKLGLELVPVRWLDITESEAHLLALTDNRTSELTDWTAELSAVLAEFETADANFAGWSADELEKMSAHLIAEGNSGEVDLGELAGEAAKHKCPQCGCEFD